MLSTLLGVRLTLYLGPAIAVPAPPTIAEALTNVEVTLNSEGRDGFQLTFSAGRGVADLIDYGVVSHPLLRPFTRVILQVWMGVMPEILIDGFITRRQLTPSNEPGGSTLTVTGEDLRVVMDLNEFALPFPMMSPDVRVRLLLAKYAMYLASQPLVLPPPNLSVPLAFEQVPAYASTDLAYIEELAQETGYVFYVEPTPLPNVTLAYWGPENRLSFPQPALSVNLGPDSNVSSLSFNYDALGPTLVAGLMQEKRAGLPVPVVSIPGLRPPLAPIPAFATQLPYVRTLLARDNGGGDPLEASARATATFNRNADALRADGELDGLQYGRVLRARRLVGVRGAGFTHDGLYYVERVTHRIRSGEYKQSFSLKREGFGSILPVLPT